MSQVVLVTGASGNIGKATVDNLKQNASIKVIAGVRNVEDEKAKSLGVSLAKIDYDDEAALVAAFNGVDTVVITVANTQERTELALKTINAALKAGVKYFVLFSVAIITFGPSEKSVFAEQWHPIEKAVRDSGKAWSILRAPMFLENIFGQLGTIKGHSAFYGPADANTKNVDISVSDLGRSLATLAADSNKFNGKTFTATAPEGTSPNELAAAFSKALGREVKYVQVSYEQALESFVGSGWPKWQAEGALELMRATDKGLAKPTGDVEAITGTKSLTAEQHVNQIAAAFK
eukprot:TRINITY_DN1304_c0_g2_i1.p1 TRINITY_DN1304_c0_g2~~TRINITY_DN1304_c0_g2_i1.p1  ORF type:complete len:318 (-),score=84.15 TRINITY_DN1304_c0_g2_i1:71-943(-)